MTGRGYSFPVAYLAVVSADSPGFGEAFYSCFAPSNQHILESETALTLAQLNGNLSVADLAFGLGYG
jgi:hypothetical protein